MYYTFYICVDLLYTNEVLLHFDLSWHIYSWFSIEEKFEDTKREIRSRKSKDRQHIGQQEKDKNTNKDGRNAWEIIWTVLISVRF
jgi:hypothetical protein